MLPIVAALRASRRELCLLLIALLCVAPYPGATLSARIRALHGLEIATAGSSARCRRISSG